MDDSCPCYTRTDMISKSNDWQEWIEDMERKKRWSFNVKFRDICVNIQIDKETTVKDIKNCIQKVASTREIDNNSLRLTIESYGVVHVDDNSSLFFVFEGTNVQKLKMLVEEAMVIFIRFPDDNTMYTHSCFPSDPIESIYHACFEQIGTTHDDYWFNLYCLGQDEPLNGCEEIGNQLVHEQVVTLKFDDDSKTERMEKFLDKLDGIRECWNREHIDLSRVESSDEIIWILLCRLMRQRECSDCEEVDE